MSITVGIPVAIATKLILTGEIKAKGVHIPIIKDIYNLASYINKDDFWKAQFQQIYVNENFEFELIPIVGDFNIIFGDISNIEKKFEKLKLMYKTGFNNEGWNKYKTINLKYKNQIVCTKK